MQSRRQFLKTLSALLAAAATAKATAGVTLPQATAANPGYIPLRVQDLRRTLEIIYDRKIFIGTVVELDKRISKLPEKDEFWRQLYQLPAFEKARYERLGLKRV